MISDLLWYCHHLAAAILRRPVNHNSLNVAILSSDNKDVEDTLATAGHGTEGQHRGDHVRLRPAGG